jgi:hypothetical protein
MLKTARPVSEADLSVEKRNKSTGTLRRPCRFLDCYQCLLMTGFEGRLGQDLRGMLSEENFSSRALLSIAENRRGGSFKAEELMSLINHLCKSKIGVQTSKNLGMANSCTPGRRRVCS